MIRRLLPNKIRLLIFLVTVLGITATRLLVGQRQIIGKYAQENTPSKFIKQKPTSVRPFFIYHDQAHPLNSELLEKYADFQIVHINSADNQGNSTTKQSIAYLKSQNPDINVLNYRRPNAIPHVQGGGALPWGVASRLDEWDEWITANKTESLFMHTADPASLTVIETTTGHAIRWSRDKREVIKNKSQVPFAIQKYIVYGANSDKGPFTELARISPTNSSFFTAKKYSFYKLSILDSAGQEFIFSQTQSPSSIANRRFLKQDFTTQCKNPAPWENYDCFHANPDIPLLYNFKTQVQGMPLQVQLFVNTSRLSNFGRSDDPTYGLTMNTTSSSIYEYNLEYTPPKVVENFPSGDYGGLAYYFIATYQDGAKVRYPKEYQLFTTNINNRIRQRLWGSYIMEIRQDDWISHNLATIRRNMASFGINGFFMDLSTTNGNPTYRVFDAMPEIFFNKSSRDAFLTEFNLWKIKLYQALNTQFKDQLIIFNGAHKQKEILAYADGDMIEGFTVLKHDDDNNERDWLSDMTNYLELAQSGKVVELYPKIPHFRLNTVSADDYQKFENYRWFALTSYLLGKSSSKVYYALSGAVLNEPEPELYLDIGQPTDLFNLDSLSRGLSVYIRRYEKGTVVVNPTDYPVTLSEVDPNWRLFGNHVVRIQKAATDPITEILNLEPATGTMVIPKRSGRVLVKKSFITPLPTEKHIGLIY